MGTERKMGKCREEPRERERCCQGEVNGEERQSGEMQQR